MHPRRIDPYISVEKSAWKMNPNPETLSFEPKPEARDLCSRLGLGFRLAVV